VRRTFFIILAGAGGLVALLLIAVAVAVWRVDPNDFVAPIQARIKNATGRDVTIRGGIDLKLSLTPKIVVHDLAVANAPWGRAPQMMTTKQFELEVALLPLLHKRFEVIRIGLVEPSIALESDAQGHANWDFAGAAAGAAPASGVATLPAAFGVGNIAVTGGTLTYRDGKSGTMTKVAIDSFSLSARNAQSPVNAEFRGRVDDVAVALTGQLGPLESLIQRRWPYPFALAGEIDGQKANIGAKLSIEGEAVHVEQLEIAIGPNVVKGTVSVVTGGALPRYTINLTAPVLTLAQTAAAVGASAGLAAPGATSAGGVRARSTYLFSEAPLPLAVLRKIDATGEATVGRLIVSPTREFTEVQIRFTLHDGRLDVPLLKAATFGGSVEAHMTLDVPASGPPALALNVDARNLDLGAELAALDVRRDVKGGKASVKAELHARGASLHDLAASVSGNVAAIAGPATIANTKLNPDSALDRVAKAANPFRDKDPTTELKCAVIRLPLAGGIAHIDRSIAAETQKLGVSVSGTLDLRNESIDVTFKPQLREGIPIDVSQIAELVRLRGPLRDPQVTIDAMASATTIARIGAGFSTGGLSELGVALFGAAGRGGPGPCAVALGAPAAKATATDAKAPAAQGTESLSHALGKLLGH
jgi:hypothetical protein